MIDQRCLYIDGPLESSGGPDLHLVALLLLGQLLILLLLDEHSTPVGTIVRKELCPLNVVEDGEFQLIVRLFQSQSSTSDDVDSSVKALPSCEIACGLP